MYRSTCPEIQYNMTVDIIGDTIDEWERDLQPINDDHQSEIEGGYLEDASQ